MSYWRKGALWGCVAAAFFAAGYLVGSFQTGSDETAPTPGATADQLPADPMLAGAVLYTRLCVTCHQPSGLGVAHQIPPLVGSEWVLGSDARLKRIVLGGLNGPLKVRGEVYTGTMPPIGNWWDDRKVAYVLTYVRHAWGNGGKPISIESVNATRRAMGNPRQLGTQDELQNVQGDDPIETAIPAPSVAVQPATNPSR